MTLKSTKKTNRTVTLRRPPEPIMSIEELFTLIRFLEGKDEVQNRRSGIHPQILADLIRFQFYTACRPGEVLIARPCDFKPSGDILLYKPPMESKMGKPRIIYVGGLAKQLIESYCKKRRKKDCLFSHPDQPTVPFTSAAYLKSLKRFCGEAEMKTCLPSRLRNIAATFLFREYGRMVAMEILGFRIPLSSTSPITVPDTESTARVAAEWNQKVMDSLQS